MSFNNLNSSAPINAPILSSTGLSSQAGGISSTAPLTSSIGSLGSHMMGSHSTASTTGFNTLGTTTTGLGTSTLGTSGTHHTGLTGAVTGLAHTPVRDPLNTDHHGKAPAYDAPILNPADAVRAHMPGSGHHTVLGHGVGDKDRLAFKKHDKDVAAQEKARLKAEKEHDKEVARAEKDRAKAEKHRLHEQEKLEKERLKGSKHHSGGLFHRHHNDSVASTTTTTSAPLNTGYVSSSVPITGATVSSISSAPISSAPITTTTTSTIRQAPIVQQTPIAQNLGTSNLVPAEGPRHVQESHNPLLGRGTHDYNTYTSDKLSSTGLATNALSSSTARDPVVQDSTFTRRN